METKRYWAALQLLDRQIVDRDGLMAGNVDDVEVEVDDDGRPTVTALLTGPGTLWTRFGARRLGDWLRRAHARVDGDGEDPARVPLRLVAAIGANITVSASRHELGSFAVERWVRDHVIGRIPGSRHAPPSE